jgi:pimeloyl-ACP methyl ester carboxylesterase
MPRHAQREMEELHALLVKAGEREPFLLLGHSLGALNLQVYAAAYPSEVAGLVLLDPPPRDWLVGDNFPEYRSLFSEGARTNRAEAAAALSSEQPQERTKAGFLLAVASEFEELFAQSASQVAAIHTFEDVPLVVIGATAPNPGPTGESFRQFWNGQSQQLAGRSSRGQFIAAEGSSHNVHLDAPDLVRRVISQMLSATRG